MTEPDDLSKATAEDNCIYTKYECERLHHLLRISLICAFRIFSRFRTAFNIRRKPGYKIWRLFKFEFSEVNINSQCLLVLNDRSIDENLKRRKREKMRNAHISEMRSKKRN